MRARADSVERRLARDPALSGLPAGPAGVAPVTEAELVNLPQVVRRYLGFMGVAGRRPDWSFTVHFEGRFRMRPGRRWMRCETRQYNAGVVVARLFHMRLDVAGIVPLFGRDSYLGGTGRMHGTLLGVIPVVKGEGPEFDVSELVTYLNDAVFFAPSVLMRFPVSWSGLDERHFEVTLEDAGKLVRATVAIDERGAPIDFSTDDRYCALPGGLVRMRWTTPVGGWHQEDGRWLPGFGSAIWHMPEGPFPYAEFELVPGGVRYNVAPAFLARSAPPRGTGADVLRSLRNWGSTEAERAQLLRGDDLVAEPADTVTRAVTVDAPAEEVWAWLVQIGQDRGGLYSYDWVERLLGLHIHSAEEIRDEWQHLAAGEEVRLVPPGWLGMKKGFALPVAMVDPGRSLVLRERPPEHPWDAVWSFHVQALDDRRCRLVSRSRAARQHGLGAAMSRAMEPVTLVMERKMLLGIKERAEHHRPAAA